MIKLQTPVPDLTCRLEIGYKNKIMLLGSCFSDNIGTILKNYGFNVLTNPFGALYNPLSIAQSILRIADCREFMRTECIPIGAGDQRICSHWHHTSFARNTEEEFLSNANDRLHEAHDFLKECDTVIITLGTSQVFDKKGITVNNCLKQPAKEFTRRRLDSTEILESLQKIIRESNIGKEKRYIFTVSPVRHLADGAHNNQLHKAALLLGTDQILDMASQNGITADYFPAYEIMMDELRDYRFYAEDLCHPSAQAVNYIAERFLNWVLPAEEHTLLEAAIKKYKSSLHISKA